ncbi:unnamed protein product [Linum trigynum]|uniref:CCHC-type domain-containing protein n=1 Tax=Linum trigynum TaxID=586398 RepID=A0AAV2G7A1_9ROSI
MQAIRQGSRTVEEYAIELELLMTRADIRVHSEARISRFYSGLNKEIQYEWKLCHFVDLEEAIHLAVKIEKQLKEGAAKRVVTPRPSNAPENAPNTAPTPIRVVHLKPIPQQGSQDRDGGSISRLECYKCHGRGHKSFQCPNPKALILRDGEYNSEDEEKEKGADDEVTDEEVDENIEMEAPGGHFLVNRRALAVEEISETQQRDNLFHTRCRIQGKTAPMVIDEGSCANVVNLETVRKLGLSTLKHHDPYIRHWLNDHGAVKVTKSAWVEFEIDQYKDRILCDVAPMHVAHILWEDLSSMIVELPTMAGQTAILLNMDGRSSK